MLACILPCSSPYDDAAQDLAWLCGEADFKEQHTRELSDRRGWKIICSSMMPALYISKRSGLFSRQRIGERTAATGTGGARGVWVDMMYCCGGAYRGSKRNSLGT